MKRLLIAVLAALILSVSTYAQESPISRPNVLVRVVHDLGHQYKSAFTDLNPHGQFGKSWLLMTTVFTAGAAADWVTTCRGLNIGNGQIHDHLFHVNSCGKFLSIALPLHITQLAMNHAITEGFVDICRNEAANPQSKWNQINARSHDPNSCKIGMWILPIVQTPFNYVNTRNNVDLVDRYQLVRR